MKRTRSFLVATTSLALGLGVIAPATAFGQDDSAPAAAKALPSAKEVVNNYIKAIGGAEAFNKRNFLAIKGKMSIPAMQMEGAMSISKARPDLMKVEIELPGFGTQTQGYNGNVGWVMDPARGPSLAQGEMLEEMKREATFGSEINILSYYDEVKVVGREDINGAACFRVTMKKGDIEREAFYDEKTHLLLATKAVMPTEMGKIPSITFYTGYKDFGGIEVPTKTLTSMMNIEQVFEVEAINFEPIEKDVFDLPPAIKALAEAAAKEAKKKATAPSKDSSESGSPRGE